MIIVVSLVMYVMYVSVDKLTVSARKEKKFEFLCMELCANFGNGSFASYVCRKPVTI